ncbi:MAG: EF-Tu/IF-2/RF-3 family GTPase [Methanothrix sp.]|nr:EF-Tu/IF-2/RF-3 family GTPase [Methanothrix sp.]
MPNINVAVLGLPDYSKELGKRGTASDLTFYNLKRGNSTVTFIEPTRYPERLAPLFYAVSLADRALLVVDQIDSTFGEEVLMLDSAGRRDGLVVLKGYISREQVVPLIRGTVVEGYEFVEDDRNALRERLLMEAEGRRSGCDSAAGTMPIDHLFNVRGIGTVVLGSVVDGTIRRHDELRILPKGIAAQVRSIQKHDEEFESASTGDRTGIALKGVEVEDLERGDVLTSDGSLRLTDSLTGRAELVRYWPAPIREGMVVHIGHWMQFIPARVESVSSGEDWHSPEIALRLGRMLVHRPGDRAVLTYPEGGKLRVLGAIELP